MPLYKSININSQTNVKIWHIKETISSFLKDIRLRPQSKSRLDSMKSQTHKLGFLSARRLLMEFGYDDYDMCYDNFGKPLLENGNYISISHSFEFSTVVVSKFPVGIDIQKQTKKVIDVASKFIGIESMFLEDNERYYLRNLTWIWCVKESLYKLYSKHGLSFKNQLVVLPIPSDNVTTSWILDGQKRRDYKCFLFEINDYGLSIIQPRNGTTN